MEVVEEVEGSVVEASMVQRVAERAGEVVESAAVAQGAAAFRLSDLSWRASDLLRSSTSAKISSATMEMIPIARTSMSAVTKSSAAASAIREGGGDG